MTDKERLIIDCRDIEKKILALNVARNFKRQEIAEINCPFVAGNKIINSNKEIVVVNNIFFSSYESYALEAKRIKKNGDLYKGTCGAYLYEKWELYNDKTE